MDGQGKTAWYWAKEFGCTEVAGESPTSRNLCAQSIFKVIAGSAQSVSCRECWAMCTADEWTWVWADLLPVKPYDPLEQLELKKKTQPVRHLL